MKTVVCSALLLAILGAPGTAAADDSAKELTPREAIERAETFVRVNGYTLAPPDRDLLRSESIEWGRSVEEIISSRRGTLKPEAYGYTRGTGAYAILFEYASGGTTTGRAVTMTLEGKDLQMEHQDAKLQTPHVVKVHE